MLLPSAPSYSFQSQYGPEYGARDFGQIVLPEKLEKHLIFRQNQVFLCN